jgi:biopolymer transport protein ExbD
MEILQPRKRRPIINITSLIDVMFLLIIFFMVSSTFKVQPGMKLELPESKTYESNEVEDLTLQILKDSGDHEKLILNNHPVSIDSLPAYLKSLMEKAEDQTLTLKADREVTHGLVVKIMDLAKQNGIKKLVIATRIKAE